MNGGMVSSNNLVRVLFKFIFFIFEPVHSLIFQSVHYCYAVVAVINFTIFYIVAHDILQAYIRLDAVLFE